MVVRSALSRTVLPAPRRLIIIILGVILLIVGIVVGIPIITTVGAILLVVGLVLTLLGALGRGVGGRKTFF